MLNEVEYEALVDEFEKNTKKNVLEFADLVSIDSDASVKTNEYEKQRRKEEEEKRLKNL